VTQKSMDRGVDLSGLREDLEALGLTITPFTIEDAKASALVRGQTAEFGISLTDRVCLALSSRLAVPALTTSRTWTEMGIDAISVRLIR